MSMRQTFPGCISLGFLGGAMNKVILIGRLGADPELKHTPSGATVLQVSLATSRRYKDKSGSLQEKTEWHRLVFWNRSAEIVAQYCKKGSPLGVEGEIQTREWLDRDQAKRYTTEIVVDRLELLGSKPQASAPPASESEAPVVDNFAEWRDDIPF